VTGVQTCALPISGADWLGIGYYYGLIDYGYTRVAADTFRVDQIPPQVFVYEILQKLFTAVGLTWQSTFFETQKFKRLLVAYFGGNLPEIDATEATFQSVTTTENNNAGGFIMNQTVSSVDAWDTLSINYYQLFDNPYILNDIVDVTIVTDPNTQTITTTPFKFRSKTAGIFNIEYNGDHIIDVTRTAGTSPNVLCKFYGYFIVKKNNVVISSTEIYTHQQNVNTTINITKSFNFFQSINLLQNDELTFSIQAKIYYFDNENINTINNYMVFNATSSGVDLNIKKQVQTFTPGDTIRINQFLTDITGDVFFKGIITAFNLYLRPSNENPTIIEIEPLNEFYNDSNAALDWSYLVDRSKEIKVTPTTNLAAKNYNFQFENDDDYWNKKYLNDYKEQYGSFLFDTQNQYATNNTDLKLPFAQKPLVVIPTTA
jgi:ribosomal protein L19